MEEQLETGLRGVPVGYCPTSYVDPQKGLFYAGKSVADLAFLDPVEVIYLLYAGKEGTAQEINAFRKSLRARARCPQEVLAAIRSLPRKGHPMQLFSIAILLLGMYESTGDYREDCLNLIGKLPQLTACVIAHHAGWKGGVPTEDGYSESFCQMLGVPEVAWEALVPMMKLFHVLHMDHGGGNLSTFVGKAVASGLEDLYGSIASAMCALAGPRHGRANQDCLEFVREMLQEVGEEATERDVEKAIRNRLADGKLIFGFGHAVLRVEDPRATVQYTFIQKNHPEHPLVKMALLLRSVGSKVLSENPKIADPHPNVDAVSGTMLSVGGFPFPEYYTLLFGMSRAVGIAIQIVYERLEARGGKGTPIIRPKYIYKPRVHD